MSSSKFSSEGFDLDAVSGSDGDVVYEIGGGTTTVPTPKSVKDQHNALDETSKSEEWKQQGNEQFKKGNYLEAYDLYTEAIEACPGVLKGENILQMRDEFKEKQRLKVMARQRLDQEDRRRADANKGKATASKTKPDTTTKPEPPPEFQLPKQPYGDKLAIYYCNRAAASTYMEKYDDAIRDCDVSVLLYPRYVKAFVRRSAAYEKSEKTEEALLDAKRAKELDPSNLTIRKNVTRLQKIEDERLEKLKEETLGKLKDLGNSILGNFGLSLDNFQAVQDPQTGSYNISFDQGGGQS